MNGLMSLLRSAKLIRKLFVYNYLLVAFMLLFIYLLYIQRYVHKISLSMNRNELIPTAVGGHKMLDT